MQIGMHFENGWIHRYIIDGQEKIEKEPVKMQTSWEEYVENSFLKHHGQAQIGVVMDPMTPAVVAEIENLRTRTELSTNQLKLYTKEEAVLGLVRCQGNDLNRGKTVLFDYTQNKFICYEVGKNAGRISVEKHDFTSEISGAESKMEKDQAFKRIITKALAKGVTTTAYLYGEGFEGQWFHESTQILCSGRRVFTGENLYACGAAYLSGETAVGAQQEEAVILTDNMVMHQIGMTLHHHGKDIFWPVIKGGRPWFESSGEMVVTVSDISGFTMEVRDDKNCKVAMISFPLSGIIKKKDVVYKLKIQAEYLSEDQCKIKVSDQGFGALRPSTHQVWQQVVYMERSDVYE